MSEQPPKPTQRAAESPADTGDVGATPNPATSLPPALDLRLGARPVPEYVLVAKLGEGAYGQVWKARDDHGIEVALKFLRQTASATDRRELDLLKNVNDAHVVPLLRWWEVGGWLVVAYQLGDKTLLDRLREEQAAGRAGIPAAELHEHLRDAARGLDFLHSKKLQHRDVKPANILLVGHSAKVADFGLAKVLESTLATNTNLYPAGTPAFMAPESWESKASIHSDQYALAVSYCQLRSGRFPFGGSAPQLMYAHLHAEPDLSMLPTEAERQAVARALAKNHTARWPTCKAFADAVAGRTSDATPVRPTTLPVQANETATWPTAPPTPPARPRSQWPGIVAVLLSLALFAGLLTTGLWPRTAIPHAHSGSSGPKAPPLEGPIKGAEAPPKADKGKPPPEPMASLRLLELKPVVVQEGKHSTLTVPVQRENLQGPIALDLKGLPPGVKAAPSRIPDGKNEARLELTADAGTAPAEAEVTLTVRAGDLRDLQRFRLEVNQFTNKVGIKLVRVPAGTFKMGSPDSDEEASSDDKPQRDVEISKPFYLGKYEVTRGQFRRFVDEDGYKTEAERSDRGSFGWNPKTEKFERNKDFHWRNVGFDQTDEHPVVCVSWNDAAAFCNWLSQQEGRRPCYQRAGAEAAWECDFGADGYRLPTEAEWEYACRAGTQTRYSSGDDPETLAKVGNVADGTFKQKFKDRTTIEAEDGYVFTAPVGKFKQNAFGLHDMHGNAGEWCNDWHAADYYGKGDNKDPKGPNTGTRHVLRGGSFSDGSSVVRSSYRNSGRPANRYGIGLRVARTYP